MYIDDLIINVYTRLKHAQNHLKTGNLDSTKFSLSLQLEHSLKNTYQFTYIQTYMRSSMWIYHTNKRYMVDIRNINLYLELTINLWQFHQENQDMTMIYEMILALYLIPTMPHQ